MYEYIPFEKNFYIFPKSAGIVIADSFGISEGFKERVSLEDLFCYEVISRFVYCGQILHN